MYQNSDLDALKLAIRTCTKIDYAKAKIVRIKDTLSLDEFEVSESMLPELMGNERVDILSATYEMEFDEKGYMKDFE